MKTTAKNFFKKCVHGFLTMHLFILFAFPSSTNYQLKSFEFGAGGGTADSANYSVEGVLGEIAGEQTSANFGADSGLAFVQNSNVPPAPTFVNSNSWYNKLHITLNTGNNPSDTVFAIAITDDDWVTTEYVQNDNTIGTTLGSEDWQTYTAWGAASGEYIIGLTPNTTYKVKVSAKQGSFTQSPWGPIASASTSTSSLVFDIDISATDSETAAPYTVSMGDLTVGSVTTATEKIWIDLTSNAENGAYVYIYDAYAGLKSTHANYTIPSTSTNLTSTTEGFGIRADSTSNITALSPYNGIDDNIGVVDTTVREIFNSGGAAVTNGRASMLIKAKTSSTTPAANDYTDTITLISAGTF